MAYTKTNWVNDVTKITAERLNNIENGIYDSKNFKKNEVLNLGTIKLGGYLTGGSRTFNFGTIFFNKDMTNVNPRITSGTATVRQSTKTINLGSLTGSEVAISRNATNGYAMNIVYTSATILDTGLTNNDAIGVLINDLEITFD